MDEIRTQLAEIASIDHASLLSTGSDRYGLTQAGFVAKPYGRLVAEGLALAREIFGPDVDLGSGSVIRRILELTSLEHARTYAVLSGMLDDQTVPTATGHGLDRLGEELGLPRPFNTAAGTVQLQLKGKLPDGVTSVGLPAGARMRTPGGHHAALAHGVAFTDASRQHTVRVAAFYPGPEHNIDASAAGRTLSEWNPLDVRLASIASVAESRNDAALEDVVEIQHSSALTGGETRWSDDRYRQLLLRVPRSVWTKEAMEVAVGLVPGVRQAKVIDRFGGIDIDLSIFGNFSFGERVFGTERDLASPYMVTILVAPTNAAIWQGPDGLAATINEAIEDLRPIGVLPDVREAVEVGVGVEANLVIDGVPLPTGTRASVNASEPALALKRRLIERVRSNIDTLGFGEKVSPAKISWALMNEPGVADVVDLRLKRFPRRASELDFGSPVTGHPAEILDSSAPIRLHDDEIAVFIDDVDDLTII